MIVPGVSAEVHAEMDMIVPQSVSAVHAAIPIKKTPRKVSPWEKAAMRIRSGWAFSVCFSSA